MCYPTLPDEFFQVKELVDMLGSQRRSGLIDLLRDAQVPHVVGAHGWPLVYRNRLLPSAAQKEEDERPSPDFNFTPLHGSSRQTSHR